MAYFGYTRPANKIVVAGNPLVQELKVETATNMFPGRLVKKGTNDDDVVVVAADTDGIVGVLGWEQAHQVHRPDTVTTIYAASAQAPVLSGSFVGVAETTVTVNKGDDLYPAAAGKLSATPGTSTHVVAIAEESRIGAGPAVVRWRL